MPANIVLCCRVGLWLQAILEALRLQCFAKTSGSKGLQLFAPLNTATTYEKTKVDGWRNDLGHRLSFAPLLLALVLQALHLLIGIVLTLVLMVIVLLSYFRRNREVAIGIFGLYWHFGDFIWIFFFRFFTSWEPDGEKSKPTFPNDLRCFGHAAGGSIFLSRLPLDPWRIALILLLAAIQGRLLIFNFMRVRLHGPLIYVTAGASFVWFGILFVLSFSDYLSRQVVW